MTLISSFKEPSASCAFRYRSRNTPIPSIVNVVVATASTVVVRLALMLSAASPRR